MKNYITCIALFLSFLVSNGQNKSIETQSISIDHLITFVVNHIENKQDGQAATNDQITFLIQTPLGDLSMENKIVLKQAFKLISERLSDQDNISIVAYSGFNGVALNQVNPKELKLILFTIDNLKSTIKEFHKDGIELAYSHANDHFEEDSKNRVIMIRNPHAHVVAPNTSTAQSLQSQNGNKKNNAVLLTAITLLPQLISVIKD